MKRIEMAAVGVLVMISAICHGCGNSSKNSGEESARPDKEIGAFFTSYSIEGMLEGWQKVTAGNYFTCAIDQNDYLWCWGANGFGQLGDGTGTDKDVAAQIGGAAWSDISAGSEHTCGIKTDGTMWCWGLNYYGQLGEGTYNNKSSPTQVGSDDEWESVSALMMSTCAMKEDATMWCWGDNETGILGDGTTASTRNTPIEVDDSVNWAQFSAGGGHACGIDTSSKLWCWGSNGSGELGDGSTVYYRNTAVQIGSANWTSVAAGNHTCGVRSNGGLYCWGNNEYGQLGDGDTANSNSADNRVGADSDWSEVGRGYNSTCAIKTSGAAYCWGRNDYGQLGLGSFESELTPQLVKAASKWQQIESGLDHACGFTDAGTLYCWGWNGYGQIGIALDTEDKKSPEPVLDSRWEQFSGYSHTSCALDSLGKIYCSGNGGYGQLGNGTTVSRAYTFESISNQGGDTTWTQVSVADEHVCALKSNGKIYCWGDNNMGKIGDGSTASLRKTPTYISNQDGSTIWIQISSCYKSTCAVKSDNSLYCWGSNYMGKLGDGSTPDHRNVPHQVCGNYLQVSCGEGTSCALETDHTMSCWGYNAYGEMGVGTLVGSNHPEPVAGNTTWKQVSLRHRHTCAIKSTGEIYCWGLNKDNSSGRFGILGLGDGVTVEKQLTPRIIDNTSTNWTKVLTGNLQTCAQNPNGELYCWGTNGYYGEALFGNTVETRSPAKVGTDKDWYSVGPGAYYYTCAIKNNGKMFCAGYGAACQIPADEEGVCVSTTKVRNVPSWKNYIDSYYFIGFPSTGYMSNCGIYYTGNQAKGRLYCWGDNDQGQLGTGDTLVQPTPMQVGSDADWTKVSVGGAGWFVSDSAHACGIKYNKKLYCWGDNTYGQVGEGSTADSMEPSPVQEATGATDWSTIELGYRHSCGIKSSSGIHLWCWGMNDHGQLGNGSTAMSDEPIEISSTADWSYIGAGIYHTCGIRSGNLYCWGDNSFGQLGSGNTAEYHTPYHVGNEASWKVVSAGAYHTCSLKGSNINNYSLWCWGWNGNGQLGMGDTVDLDEPSRVLGVSEGNTIWSNVTAGVGHTCAINANNHIYCWGANSSGQVGDDTTSDRSSPVQVGIIDGNTTFNWTNISAGFAHTCAFTHSRGLMCWGANWKQQLGLGGEYRIIPTRITGTE